MELIIESDGNARCVYSETINLRVLGKPRISRASHVEPDPAGRWITDLTPVEGPKLGPFDNRTEALEAEVQWLRENWLTKVKPIY